MSKKFPPATEEQIKQQRKGGLITAFIVGAIALGIYLFTLYVNR